jgi:hypothetical protein
VRTITDNLSAGIFFLWFCWRALYYFPKHPARKKEHNSEVLLYQNSITIHNADFKNFLDFIRTNPNVFVCFQIKKDTIVVIIFRLSNYS